MQNFKKLYQKLYAKIRQIFVLEQTYRSGLTIEQIDAWLTKREEVRVGFVYKKGLYEVFRHEKGFKIRRLNHIKSGDYDPQITVDYIKTQPIPVLKVTIETSSTNILILSSIILLFSAMFFTNLPETDSFSDLLSHWRFILILFFSTLIIGSLSIYLFILFAISGTHLDSQDWLEKSLKLKKVRFRKKL